MIASSILPGCGSFKEVFARRLNNDCGEALVSQVGVCTCSRLSPDIAWPAFVDKVLL